jgi:hypothetical protein
MSVRSRSDGLKLNLRSGSPGLHVLLALWMSMEHRLVVAIRPQRFRSSVFVRARRRGYLSGLRVIARPGTKVAVPAPRCSLPDFSADRKQPTYCNYCPFRDDLTLVLCKGIAEAG